MFQQLTIYLLMESFYLIIGVVQLLRETRALNLVRFQLIRHICLLFLLFFR